MAWKDEMWETLDLINKYRANGSIESNLSYIEDGFYGQYEGAQNFRVTGGVAFIDGWRISKVGDTDIALVIDTIYHVYLTMTRVIDPDGGYSSASAVVVSVIGVEPVEPIVPFLKLGSFDCVFRIEFGLYYAF